MTQGSDRWDPRGGWLLISLDGTIVAADEGARAAIGAPDTQALVGRSWTSVVARGDAAIVSEALAAAGERRPWHGRLRFHYLSTLVLVEAELHVADSSAEGLAVLSFLPDEAPTPAALPDQSDRTVARDSLAARVAVDDALRGGGGPDAVARSALQALSGIVRFDWGVVLRFVPRGADVSAEVVAVYPSPMAGVAARATWIPLGPAEMRVWLSGEPSLDADAGRDPADQTPLARLVGFGLRSRVHIPLYAAERLAGCAILYRRSGGFAPDEGADAEQAIRSLGPYLTRTGPPTAAPEAAAPASTPSAAPPIPPRRRSGVAPGAEAEAERPSEPGERPDRASERLSTLGELVAGVAHELNNPLTAILGYAQILGSLQGDEHDRALETIEQEAERAARIVRNLLAFARQRPGQRGPVDIEDIITRVVALRRYALEIDGVMVETRFDSTPEVVGDAAQLEEVVLNLLNNAHQALQGRGGTVTITTEDAGGQLRLTVADDGPGVPPELRPRVFEPFFTTGVNGAGQGLGLATVYGIVTEHGGRVWLEAAEPSGARFVVEFPRGRAVDAPVHAVPAPTAPPGGARTRILVVDDEEPIRALTAEVLTGSGYEVRTAPSGQGALDLLEREPFDLLVVDMRMPVMDGATFYERMSERWPRLADRVVFVTGDPDAGRSDRFRQRSVRFLEKPFDTRNLLRTIRAALDQVGGGGGTA